MIAKVEAQQAWLENVTYQMCNMVSPPSQTQVRQLTSDADLQRTVKKPRWPDRFPQDAVYQIRGRDCRRCRQHLWWSWSDQDWVRDLLMSPSHHSLLFTPFVWHTSAVTSLPSHDSTTPKTAPNNLCYLSPEGLVCPLS